MRPPTEEMPLAGKGVERLKIKKVDNAVEKYERAKDKRCQASPDEIGAKQNLQKILHEVRDQLPKNEDGLAYYRSEDDRDYILEETLKIRRAQSTAKDDDE